MIKKELSLNIKFKLKRNQETLNIEYKYIKRFEDERPMALDVLLQAQEKDLDDLAFRYGCRARNCGVCTIDINNKPRLACRARVKDGDTLSPLATLPIIKDFVVKRDGISRQMVGYNNLPYKNDLNISAEASYHNLTACIECYACLDGCPLHYKNELKDKDNNNAYLFGNPFSFLKLQRLYIDPLTTEEGKRRIIEKAKSLGLEVYRREYKDLKIKCGVGINLKDEVIKPLLDAAFGDQNEKK
mgnify:CR=1 FL=1